MPSFANIWFFGAINLIFSAVGLIAAAIFIGLSIVLGAAALGASQTTVI